jgi:hypothetical protein
MRITVQIIAAALLTAVASAQSAPASQSVKPNTTAKTTKTQAPVQKSPFAAKPASAQASKTQASKAQTTKAQASAPKAAAPAAFKQNAQASNTQSSKAQASPAKAAAPAAFKQTTKTATPHAVAAKPAQNTPVAAPAETKAPAAIPAVAENPAPKLPAPGKRDPFLSPIAAAAMKGASNCTAAGKACLVIDQVVLKGIVQMKNGSFALVENASRRPYVLHERDALFNGAVVKISGDSVIFREDSTDILGRKVSKEVIKKVSAPAV